jgi:hypothetical protein
MPPGRRWRGARSSRGGRRGTRGRAASAAPREGAARVRLRQRPEPRHQDRCTRRRSRRRASGHPRCSRSAREIGAVLEGLESGLRERVVVGHAGARMRLGEAEVGEELGHELRAHRAAAVGVHRELSRLDGLALAGLRDELLGEPAMTDDPAVDGQASPLVIGEPQPPPAELLAEGRGSPRARTRWPQAGGSGSSLPSREPGTAQARYPSRRHGSPAGDPSGPAVRTASRGDASRSRWTTFGTRRSSP